MVALDSKKEPPVQSNRSTHGLDTKKQVASAREYMRFHDGEQDKTLSLDRRLRVEAEKAGVYKEKEPNNEMARRNNALIQLALCSIKIAYSYDQPSELRREIIKAKTFAEKAMVGPDIVDTCLLGNRTDKTAWETATKELIRRSIDMVIKCADKPILALEDIYFESKKLGMPSECRKTIIIMAIDALEHHGRDTSGAINRMLSTYKKENGCDTGHLDLEERYKNRREILTNREYVETVITACDLIAYLSKNFFIEPPEYEDIMALPLDAGEEAEEELMKRNAEKEAEYRERIRKCLLADAIKAFPVIAEKYSINSSATIYELIMDITKAAIRSVANPTIAAYAVHMISTELWMLDADPLYRGMVLFSAIDHARNGDEEVKKIVLDALRCYEMDVKPEDDCIDVQRLIGEIDGPENESGSTRTVRRNQGFEIDSRRILLVQLAGFENEKLTEMGFRL